MTSEIRFCTAPGGVRLAYSVAGDGPPLLIVPSWISHLELDEQELVPPEFFRTLARGNRLIRYDKRGMGLSTRHAGDYSLEAQVGDLHALVVHLDVERVTLFGSSQGGAIAIAYAAAYPERVSRLILFGAYHYVPDGVREVLGSVLPLVRRDWTGLGTAPMLEMFVPGASAEARELFSRYQCEAADGEDAAAILEALAGYSVTGQLAAVGAPTLVLHRRDDRVVSVEQGREITAAIPDARFVALEGQVHLPYWGDTQPLLTAIEAFLSGKESVSTTPVVPHAEFHAVLWTDIVGHTAMMQRLGDVAGRAILRDHERTTREVLRTYGGVEVKTLGDGFMGSFTSVTAAVECAIALQRAFSARNEAAAEPLYVRVAVNAGEPIEEDGDLFGATVTLAARIATQADGEEILVPEPVRHLVAGKGFVFADRGEFLPKGFEDAVRLFEVRWRE
jgi:pimeloyl-ACP methyl ester carboxylesterase